MRENKEAGKKTQSEEEEDEEGKKRGKRRARKRDEEKRSLVVDVSVGFGVFWPLSVLSFAFKKNLNPRPGLGKHI